MAVEVGSITVGGKTYTATKVLVSKLIDKEISEDGTYLASEDNADGYKKVVVNTSSES